MIYSPEEFERLVAQAVEDLPQPILEILENVAVCTATRPTKRQLRETGTRKEDMLLGLYEGVPQTQWGRGLGGTLPDKITIFQESTEQFAQTPEAIKEEIRHTVWHEIAHHFGWSDEEIPGLEQRRISKKKNA